MARSVARFVCDSRASRFIFYPPVSSRDTISRLIVASKLIRLGGGFESLIHRWWAGALQVVTDPRKIAVNYVKSWFVVDAIAAVPIDLLLFGTGTSDVSMITSLY